MLVAGSGAGKAADLVLVQGDAETGSVRRVQFAVAVGQRLDEQVFGHEQGAEQFAAVGGGGQGAVQVRGGSGGDGGLDGGPAVAGDARCVRHGCDALGDGEAARFGDLQ